MFSIVLFDLILYFLPVLSVMQNLSFLSNFPIVFLFFNIISHKEGKSTCNLSLSSAAIFIGN